MKSKNPCEEPCFLALLGNKQKMIKDKTTIKKPTRKRTPKAVVSESVAEAKPKPMAFYEGVGRRKTSVARVRLFAKAGEFLVNEKTLEQYFPTIELKEIVASPFKRIGLESFGASIIVKGGGVHSQAEAVRHGIAKALLIFNPEFRKKLKTAGFLTRDARMRERKKFGLKRARRAPQWQKR